MNRILHAAVLAAVCPLALALILTAVSRPLGAQTLGAQICMPTNTALVFDGDYRVSMCYTTPDGSVGHAESGIWSSQESGLLWFFDRGNAEVLVKVLDACSLPASQGGTGHRWVFVAPVTTLGFNLQITAPSGQVWRHTNSPGRTATTKSDLYAFSCSGRPSGPSGFDLASVNADSRGITYANGHFFVVDWFFEEVYVYDATTRSWDYDYGFDFGLSPWNHDPQGITYWNGHLLVVDSGFVEDSGGAIFAHSASTGVWQDHFALAVDNHDPRGIAVAAIDGTDYLFVVDGAAGNEKVYAYDAATRMHDPTYDFELAPENTDPEGISFADAGGVGVLLVVDGLDRKAYAYGLQRQPSADVSFDAHNTDPRGIVQHDGVLYVVDGTDSYVYAYAPYGLGATQADSLQPVLSAPLSERTAGAP
ncbi:MAG: hypothetical protein F4Y16_07355 [Holophagales bacterium]|nr:hypothetical protein [Holophagales bacterium]MYH26094.1 hypothetical protein [Holophagales bacterium]